MGLPTPDTSHLDSDESIYPPSEDSYLLLDTLSSASESAYLASHFASPSPAPLVLEIGPGSGIVTSFITTFASEIFGRRDVLTLAADVNPAACSGTAQTVGRNLKDAEKGHGIFLDALWVDLDSCLRGGEVDVLVFNPPYVPTESVPVFDENGNCKGESEGMIEAAWAGGKDGMEVTERVLKGLERCLSKRGVAYVLFCAQNRVQEVIGRLEGGEYGRNWKCDIVGRTGKTAGWEKLCIVRITR
ncbi:hypothetical protein BJ508DRAFT_411444 [Ascobolus immersus RN42]|uniref:S-adenosyl-L-methionine-dependent methyltransferase n=1 Tax=Ascobolus immersus RN42 TaxID=1160509 RepID=A0A3N4IKA3_ASCIM|nr:hypothetical protein BJ508DRAFT_411444 [Ascobolus immersus RN42]